VPTPRASHASRNDSSIRSLSRRAVPSWRAAVATSSMMTARCLGAGWAADRDSVNAASASPGRVSLTATSARYPASLAWSNGNTHGQGGGSVRRSASMALAARARACEAASPSRRAAAKLRASVASSHARGDGCGVAPICWRASPTRVSPSSGSPLSVSNAARLPSMYPASRSCPAWRARPTAIR
jgi:hypothetical protein